MPYGIIVLPGKPAADGIAEYSRRLAAGGSALMHLGGEAPAHLSIAHFECAPAAAEACWAGFSKAGLPPAGVPVDLVRLAFNPLPPGDYYVPEGASRSAWTPRTASC